MNAPRAVAPRCRGTQGGGRAATCLALTLLLAGCGADPETNPGKPTPRAPAEHFVTVTTVERAPVASRHERPGSLRLRRLVRILSQEEGRVTALDLFEGDRVAAGDLLVRLEDDLLRAQLDKARATQAQRRLDLERLQSLVKRRAASEDELARAATEVTIAGAEVRLLETRLAYTRIVAPFAGVITERLVEPGDFVGKQTHLLTLADPDSLIAEVFASELVLPHLAVGGPVQIRIDALGGALFDGEILRIHPTLAEGNRQGRVEVRFGHIPDGARAGQFIRVELATAAVPRLTIPFRALRQDRDGAFVWAIDERGRAARRPIETGLRLDEQIEVVGGLDAGTRIVTSGFLGLAEGKSVRVVEVDDGP